jgi:hypothetical protein
MGVQLDSTGQRGGPAMLARGRGSFAPIMVASAGSRLDNRCRLVVDDVVGAHAPPSIAATVAATASSMCTKEQAAASIPVRL